MIKHFISILMVLTLVLTLPLQAFAETYYLEDGSVVITTDATDQYVSQNGGTAQKQTTETVITQRDSATAVDKTITVDTTASGAKAAEVTIQDVNIQRGGTGIEVGASSATITVEGTNTVTATESNSAGTNAQKAAIHVDDGNLTITGGAGDTLNAIVTQENPGSYGQTAVIGSNAYQALDGSITITGDLTVNARGDNTTGASIGTGFGGDLNGTIAIQGGTVNAVNDKNVAIGTSQNLNTGASIEISGGSVNSTATRYSGIGAYKLNGGSITISGGNVSATGGTDGAGIGATYANTMGSDVGSINITGGNVTATGGKSGAGIGNASGGAITTDINITGGTVTAIGGEGSAGIGGGKGAAIYGSITIGADAQVVAQAGAATEAIAPNAIGNGGRDTAYTTTMGSVTITGDAQVYLANNGTTKPEVGGIPGTTISGNASVTPIPGDYTTAPSFQSPAPAAPAAEEAEEGTHSFWEEIHWQLTKAEDGSTFSIDAGSATWMPRYIVKTAQSRNITLMIHWSGGEVTIAPTAEVDLTAWQIRFANLT